jgi:osomolarity two-component system sensor histidine kinase TcsA
MVLSPSNSILQVSQGFCDVSDFSRDECVGLEFVDLLDRVPFVHDDVLQDIQRAVVNRRHYTTDPIQVDIKYWQTRIIPIFETSAELLYIVLEFVDVTKECMENQALQSELQSKDIYRLLVNTVKDYAIFLLDSKGYVATWNTGAAILKQYTAEEIIGKHFSTFYSAKDIEADIPAKELELAVQEGKFEDSGWRYRKDKSRFWANVVITPLYKDDVLVGFTKVTRDMTEQHVAQARLVAEYEEASKLKSQFLANVSHEIRSPMHGMLSAIGLLTETRLNSEQRELAGIIQDSGSILLQVINDILDYSKLSSGVFQTNSIDMSVRDTINAVIRSTETGIKSGLELRKKIAENVPDRVNGDPLRFRQVLQNIVNNAIKFTDFGYVEVSIKLVEEKGCTVTLLTEVTDTGVGIPSQCAGSLFTPFTQLDNSATKKFKGTGLGLSICKSLVGLMGGSIGFRENQDGIGSVFWFTVTMSKSKLPYKNHIVNSALSIIRAAATKRVLLVEDNPVNQKVMVKTLKNLGFTDIDVADNGQQGVETFQNSPYDLVLMDISMPVKDGCEATKEIRRLGSSVPIIAMTANALKGDAERFLSIGMSDYIAKPIDKRLLVNLLAKWLNQNENILSRA